MPRKPRGFDCEAVIDGAPCGLPALVMRWCVPHYRQQARGAPFSTPRSRRASGTPAIRDEQGRKHCPRCDTWLSVDNFSASAGTSDRLQTWCSRCCADHRSLDRYGMTRSEVAERAATQGGCAMCGTTPPDGSDPRSGWHVDHDHSCCPKEKTCGKCIRAILCSRCNRLLGAAGDDVHLLRRAIQYLERRHEAECGENSTNAPTPAAND